MNKISFVTGDIFNSKMQTIVIPVNCKGSMGKGLALEFKNRHPNVYNNYKYQEIKIGKLLIYRVWYEKDKVKKWFVLFPTKDHWKNPSKIDYIELGLQSLNTMIHAEAIESIAIPPLGCGLGGLDWHVVLPLIVQYAEQWDIPVEIYNVMPKCIGKPDTLFLPIGKECGDFKDGYCLFNGDCDYKEEFTW